MNERKHHLILGAGQIGTALAEVLRTKFSVDVYDPYIEPYNVEPPAWGRYDMIHVAYPYFNDEFIEITKDYYEKTRGTSPKPFVIHSSVPIGTTRRICEEQMKSVAHEAVHSPVRGVHPELRRSLKVFVKYVGYINKEIAEEVAREFSKVMIKTKLVEKPENTEALKLLSTLHYGVDITLMRKIKDYCDEEGLNFDDVYTNPTKTYNQGYKRLNHYQFIRPVLKPDWPKSGPGTGGHCIIENAILLYQTEEELKDLCKFVMSNGKWVDSKEKLYKNREWMWCEYIGKEKTMAQISREIGCSDVTIQNWIKKFNIPKRPTIWTEKEEELLEELAQEMTFKDIYDSKLLGYRTYASIRIHAIKLGISSPYDPGERDEETRKKISCSLRNIDYKDFDGFIETENDRLRNSEQYFAWRRAVLKRDNWVCQAEDCKYCKNKQGKNLSAHYIKPWSLHEELRFKVSNGITYCKDYHYKNCHIELRQGVNNAKMPTN